jgi:kinesin family protein 20
LTGLNEIQVDSVEEVLTLMKAGMNKMHISETALNHQSSRSHCLLTVKIVGIDNIKNPSNGRAGV